jgi:hypothetical protein
VERRVYGLEDDREHHRESAVDEGTVDDDVYLVEAIPEDGDAYGDRESPRKPTTHSAKPTCLIHPLRRVGHGVQQYRACMSSTAPA